MKKTYTNTIGQDLSENLSDVQRGWIRIPSTILLSFIVIPISAFAGLFSGIGEAWKDFTVDCIRGTYVSPELREEKIKQSCGCVCFCPECRQPLNDQECVVDEELATYTCSCGEKSTWHFGIAPVPILMLPND